jgi:small subunit ribosomal protein S20
MPNNRNAAKAMRQANKRRLRNRSARTSLRTVIKKVHEAVTSAATTNDAASVDTALKTATKKLDQAASKKFIHRNKAARLKSRLSALARKKATAAAKPAN